MGNKVVKEKTKQNHRLEVKMHFKDLRSVVDEQTKTNVIVEAGDSSVTSGTLWLFSVDKSIDELEVKEVSPHDNILEVTLTCSPSMLRDTDWDATFNQDSITELVSGDEETLK